MANKVASLMLIVAIMIMTVSLGAKAQTTCSDVVSAVSECATYITNGGAVPTGCCSGIKSLYAEAETSTDRQTICKCLKSAASQVPDFKPALLEGLPDKCSLTIPYKISPSTNCNALE